jgi:hypothetical protein
MPFRGEGDWGVSTLTPMSFTREPMVTLFGSERDAIDYARLRAHATGESRKARGRIMYVLHYPEVPEGQESVGELRYRALRGQRGARQRPGSRESVRQEQILVFERGDLLPDGRSYRWVLKKGLTLDVEDIEEEREKARLGRGTRAMTLFERYGDRDQ